LRAICLILLGNVVLVNNILRNRTDGSLTLTNQTLLQNFKDSIPTSGSTAAIIGRCRKVTGGRLHFNQQKKRGVCPAFSVYFTERN
jgi:hypothetical protein